VDVDPALILENLGAAKRFADPSAPLQARVMAAGGALPLPPDQIASVLFCLSFDPDEDVAEKASDSLDSLPEGVLNVAIDAAVPAGLLARWVERFRGDADKLERIALNAATADETMCLLATLPYGRIIDIVSHNQIRLLRSPDLVEALSENPAASQATIDRVLEFLGIKADADESAEPEDLPEAPEPLAGTEATGAETFDPDDPEGLPEDLLIEGDEIEEDEEKLLSLYQQVQNMNVMEKVKLARFGNGEARALLVRDRNKIVALAAIRSPKLKESEVVAFAKSRNLSDEVLRVIANAREWTKSYQIKLALVMNPRTPLSSAIKFLNYLTDRDLRGLMRSRDVPGQISTQARRILGRKGKV
jgi:hypothetical protein